MPKPINYKMIPEIIVMQTTTEKFVEVTAAAVGTS